METIKNKNVVKGCYNECPFYQTSGNCMECGHPYFEKQKDPYSCMIITQDNSRDGNIPEECPLRKESIKLVKIVGLANDTN
jgi:hypothetical protein